MLQPNGIEFHSQGGQHKNFRKILFSKTQKFPNDLKHQKIIKFLPFLKKLRLSFCCTLPGFTPINTYRYQLLQYEKKGGP